MEKKSIQTPHQEDTHIAKKYMNRFLSPCIVRKLQTETVRYVKGTFERYTPKMTPPNTRWISRNLHSL